MTEISWLHDRNYSLARRRDIWLLMVGRLVLINATGSVASVDKSALHLVRPYRNHRTSRRHPDHRVLALAYLYHSLHWFSKVQLIGWARISPMRGGIIVALWLGAVAVYFHSYLLGFALLLILGFMHVALVLPLNHRPFRETGGFFGKKLSLRPAR